MRSRVHSSNSKMMDLNEFITFFEEAHQLRACTRDPNVNAMFEFSVRSCVIQATRDFLQNFKSYGNIPPEFRQDILDLLHEFTQNQITAEMVIHQIDLMNQTDDGYVEEIIFDQEDLVPVGGQHVALKVEDQPESPRKRKSRSIFLNGLKKDVEDSDLREYFGRYGNVVKAEISTDKTTGKKKKYGFVKFDDSDAVDRVVQEGHHVIKGTEARNAKAKRNKKKNNSNKVSQARTFFTDRDDRKRVVVWNSGSVGSNQSGKGRYSSEGVSGQNSNQSQGSNQQPEEQQVGYGWSSDYGNSGSVARTGPIQRGRIHRSVGPYSNSYHPK